MRIRGLLLFIVCAVICSCSKVDLDEAAKQPGKDGWATIRFRVTDYKQEPMAAPSRAANLSDLPHLALAVFSATTGEATQAPILQNKGKEGYGAFQLTLPYGTYRIVCVGYDKDTTPTLSSATALSFGDGSVVPQTFLYSEEMVVDKDTKPTHDIILRRAVAAFRLVIKDALPMNLASVRFKSDGGGSILNPTTGFSVDNKGRTAEVAIPKEYLTMKGETPILYYLFLPSQEITTNCVIEALDVEGRIIEQRAFNDVPMKVNVVTEYAGNFFSAPTSDTAMDVLVDKAWAGTQRYSY